MIFRLLNADEIEVKVKQVTEKGAVALLYKTARTDMTLLDETVGAGNWQTDYREIKGNMYCGIGIYQSPERGYVWKWNCGTESREDGEGNEKKGEASDAFKRAGTTWGIGRELYTAPFIFLNVETKEDHKDRLGKSRYILADKFQTFEVSKITYNENRTIKSVVIVDNHGTVVYGRGSSGKKRVQPAQPELPAETNAQQPATPPKPAQNQEKPAAKANPTAVAESGRRTTVNALRAASKCPSDAIILFMKNCAAKSYDDLTEQQYTDLVNFIKSYAKKEG
nr:MAG TPA: Rad52/22 family double-strand break repair protein [Caudoviricetes sp.]